MNVSFYKRAFASRRTERGVSMVELIMVVTVALIVTGIAIPSFVAMRRSVRISGDAKNIAAEILMAKMRASSSFTQSRIYFDLSNRTFATQLWIKPVPPATTGSWQTESAAQPLAEGVSFGVGSITSAPAGTQTTFGQAAQCRNDTGALPGTGSAISNTACIIFNSRGIPITYNSNPTGDHAIYVTDGTAVFGNTISATGQLRTWRSEASAAHWERR